jgi:hypothetical protein
MKKQMLLAMVFILLLGAGIPQADAAVTMKFPAGTTVFYDRSGAAVRPDASGNAAAPTLEISDYLAAGFTFYTDWLNEGSINLYFTTARARAAMPMTTLGDVMYGGASGAVTRLAGNTAATNKFLSQTGTGTVSAAPVWAALLAGDIPDISATYLTAAQKAAASGVASLDGSSLVVQNPANATATPTASKIPIADASGTLNAWYTPTTPLTSYAAGTAYALTATPAQAVFGTTSPALTVTSAGTWSIRYRAHVKYTGATFGANQTATLKLRRTNNTAADLANSPATAVTDIVTTATGTLAWVEGEVIYTTANTDDVIQLWGSVSDVPSAGSLDVVEANIIAVATK